MYPCSRRVNDVSPGSLAEGVSTQCDNPGLEAIGILVAKSKIGDEECNTSSPVRNLCEAGYVSHQDVV